ncbi:MAG: TRAP transporter substrate-binding protein [Microscillaceae bacterium]|nr:TRAP transporter substrate-binding protein [Microscillaceae bacterium]
MQQKNNRREFLKKGVVTTLSAGLGALSVSSCQIDKIKEKASINITSDKKYQWILVTTWPPKFPVFGEALDMLARTVKTCSAGRMEIKVMGAGELIPALECFDAVSQGAAQIASGVSYYWSGKLPAAQFFAAIPFGMNAQQMNAWIINGGGLKLWEELYAEHDLIPIPGGNTGVQMGGWFKKEINSIEDIKGLKMRMPGLGGKVLAKAGGIVVLSPGNELYTNLERGIIDATEWIGPYHDYTMGFYSVAPYYYYPGWHEPGPMLEMIVNKSKFEALPLDLQEIIRNAIYRMSLWILGEFEAKNNFYLKKLVQEEDTKLKKYPDEVLAKLKVYSQEVIEEIIAKDAPSKKVYESFLSFRKDISEWSKVTEKVFYDAIL